MEKVYPEKSRNFTVKIAREKLDLSEAKHRKHSVTLIFKDIGEFGIQRCFCRPSRDFGLSMDCACAATSHLAAMISLLWLLGPLSTDHTLKVLLYIINPTSSSME